MLHIAVSILLNLDFVLEDRIAMKLNGYYVVVSILLNLDFVLEAMFRLISAAFCLGFNPSEFGFCTRSRNLFVLI